MSYSDEAIIFSQIPVQDQLRLEDRVSFAYLEYCQVVQDKTGVLALSSEEGESKARRLQLPVAGIAVLLLGPGTSITQPAAASCARAGMSVLFSGGGGSNSYSLGVPLTTSARWAVAQARLVANDAACRRAAKFLYKKQLGIDIDENLRISQMRGIEGKIIAARYRELTKKYGFAGFKRDTLAKDHVNTALNMANGILYGCAAASCSVLGINPALGIIHRGDVRSLLFDLADQFKPFGSMPVAFKAATTETPLESARKEMRSYIFHNDVMQKMLGTLTEILSPHLPEIFDDRLLSDRGDVAGHTLYQD